MARTRATVAAPASAVWAVLSDGWSYSSWVVGTAKIRAVDPEWPATGTKLHHAFGAWPAMLKDESEVLDSEPGRRLLLQARGWPAGEATVEIILEPNGTGTTVEIAEKPTAGPGRWVDNPLLDAITKRRLGEMLARLAAIAEGRHGTPPLPG